MDVTVQPSIRVCLYVCVNSVPGDPQRRWRTLGDALCQKLYQRDFNAKVDPAGYDACHIPGDFDSELPIGRWFAYDLNVTHVLRPEETLELPHLVYLASLQRDEWYVALLSSSHPLICLVGFSWRGKELQTRREPGVGNTCGGARWSK